MKTELKVKESYNVTDVAIALKKSEKTIYLWVKEEKINFHRVGAAIRFYAEDVANFIKSK